jgi:choline dehydrogenase-like flavoprotein
MLLDINLLSEPARIDADVCIVGAGAAGLTLARELAGLPIRVCLLEGGGLKSDHGAQALMRGESVGRPTRPLEQVRVSGFGGTTNVWAGACRPFDALDFCERDWVPHSGWPITRAQLEPFYRRAHAVCELGSYSYAVEDWARWGEQPLKTGPEVETHVFHLSRTRFGLRYRKLTLEAPNIMTCLGVHAVNIESDPLGQLATQITGKTLGGKEVSVVARAFVLAAGGLENPRLLLLSREQMSAGLGNRYDQVGRFFMDHLYLDSGVLELAEPNAWSRLYSVHRAHEARIEGVLALTDNVQRRYALLRCAFLFPPRWRTGAAYYSPAVTSLLALVRAVRLGHVPYEWKVHVRAILAGHREVSKTTVGMLGERWRPPRRLMLRAFAEQAPNPDSRVTLADRVDALGRPLARLDWQVRKSDFDSLRQAHEVLRRAIECVGLGRVDLPALLQDDAWTARVTGGYHHMGTTRMHVDPRHGVVDADCKVHGIANLFIAGSSVFPTGGYANPTLTIIALAVRLADHLKGMLL